MNFVMRIGDTVEGICYAHDSPRNFIGTFTTGSGTVRAHGLAIVRVGDTGTTDCGHTIQATNGSAVGKADGIPIHRVGDTGIVLEDGTFTSVSGDPTTRCD